MTAADAEALARVLRQLCILREGQILHIGGHAIGPLKLKRRPTAASPARPHEPPERTT